MSKKEQPIIVGLDILRVVSPGDNPISAEKCTLGKAYTRYVQQCIHTPNI